MNANVNGSMSGTTLQLWATINGGTDIFNLSIIGNINGTVLNGNYRITNNSSIELESGTLNLVKSSLY